MPAKAGIYPALRDACAGMTGAKGSAAGIQISQGQPSPAD